MRYSEFVKTWFKVGHRISWKLSWKTLVTLLYFHRPFQNDFIYKTVQSKHDFIFDYLKSKYPILIEKWKNIPNTPSLEHVPRNRKIWIMWWQGEDEAPFLIKKCIESIRENSDGAEVIVITKENYENYVTLPAYIIEKHNSGIISFAQLSDIMRINLLSSHGGLWLDATIWCSQPIPKELFKRSFWTPHTTLRKTPFVQNDRMHCFIMGGIPHSKLLEYEKDFLNTYWKEHDVIIDYYLLDYSLMLAYWNFDDIRHMIDELPYTSETLYGLVRILNNPFDKKELNQLLNENIFSKLNRYIKYKTMRNGLPTNYAKLMQIKEND